MEAITELNNLAAQVQEAQKTSANIGTMLPVYNELAGYPGVLLEPSRVLRKEGLLALHTTSPDVKENLLFEEKTF